MLQIDSRQFVQEHGLFACIQCGKCTGGCPMAMKTKLNPRMIIYRLLVAGKPAPLRLSQGLAAFQIDRLDEHEVAVIE